MSRKNENMKTVESKMGNATSDSSATQPPMTLAEVRQDLKGVKGKKFWRSIDELANTAEFQAAVEKEFPSAAAEWVDPVSRRGFLKVMGASMALAGLAGCTKQPDEPIYPYVKAPEDLILGKPMYFASAHPFTTGAVPVLIKSDEFRPIKVDGNPEHGYNHGSSDPYSQGTLLDLYDPDRSQHVLFKGEGRSWAEFAEAFQVKAASTKDGAGIYFLSAAITSPTLARQWSEVQKALSQGHAGAVRARSGRTFLTHGSSTQFDLSAADIIVSLDADFLSGASYPGFHKLVRDYADRRRQPENGMNRLYAVESSTTTTGMKAEHRLGLRASEVPAFAAALAQALSASPESTLPPTRGLPISKSFLPRSPRILRLTPANPPCSPASIRIRQSPRWRWLSIVLSATSAKRSPSAAIPPIRCPLISLQASVWLPISMLARSIGW